MDDGNGETAPPEQPESSRGAGGKMRKPPIRKSRTTPYARPQSQTPLVVRSGSGGWFSKLVDPAYRLIGAGANRILPSLFSRSPIVESPASSSSSEEEHVDKLQSEAEQDDEDGNNKVGSDLALIGSTQSKVPESVRNESKDGDPFGGKREEGSLDLPNDGILEIEQVIRGKMFSRVEVDRLMEILRSKTVDPLPNDGRDKQTATNIIREAIEPVTAADFARKLNKENEEVLKRASKEVLTPLPKSNLQSEISASPVDVARAYMGRRMSELGSSSLSTAIGDDRALVHLDEYSSKPFIASPSQNSSIRWPGATVPNRYSTPQTQRSRYGLHEFRRTPYSRIINPQSKSKLIQLGDDDNKSLETESPLLRQPQTTVNRQVRSRSNMLNGDYGSVGPVRRSRHNFAFGTSQKLVNFPPLASPYLRENDNLPSASVPVRKKNVDSGGTDSSIKPLLSDDKQENLELGVPTVPRHSSQVARKILDHPNRNFPTIKEKSAELKLATSWKKPNFSDAISIEDAAPSHGNMEKRWNVDSVNVPESRGSSLFKLPSERSTIKIADIVGRKTSVFDADLRRSIPVNGSYAESANEVWKLAPAVSTGSQPRDAGEKPPASAAKAGLQPISIEKPIFSSGSSAGFTFPVSASPAPYCEPPTPSLTPPPSLANSHHLPREEGSVIPSFTFGQNRSSPALVFSFSSISTSSSSSGPVDATADPKFTFGSGERRVSFASIGRDGVRC